MNETDRSRFRHQVEIRVRNFEVDWQGIVHNANYLLYYEVGRMEYLRQLGVKVDFHSINGHSKVVLVRNEIDYKRPAVFDDLLRVFTRVSYIRNSSFAMEGLIEHAGTGQLVSACTAYHVWLDPATNEPTPVPTGFRETIAKYEGTNCEITQLP